MAARRITSTKKSIAPSLPADQLLVELRQMIEAARSRVATAANAELTLLYWRIGRRIHSEVLSGERARYGEAIVATLSRQLVAGYGRSFSAKSLARMVQFAEVFPDEPIVATLSRQLSWSHFRELLPLKNPLQREYYAEMCRIERWSVRTPSERIDSMLCFLLELGGGFSFVTRQKRIQLDGDDFNLDLLFYNRKLKRLIAIELKVGAFKAEFKGQMELYLRWLDKYEREPDELPPLGIILCTGKKAEQIELLEMDRSGIHFAEYLTALPSRKVLGEKLHLAAERARRQLEQRVPSRGFEPPSGKELLQVRGTVNAKRKANRKKGRQTS
jgi:hypothetical protein